MHNCLLLYTILPSQIQPFLALFDVR